MNIRAYRKSDYDNVISSMCNAFFDEELYKFFVPCEEKRKSFLKRFMKFRLSYGLKKGLVFVTEDGNGVAIWIKPNQSMTPFDLVMFGGLFAILQCDKEDRNKIITFNNFSDQQAQSLIAQPFWHLSPICVSPDHQGQGYGKALMSHGLKMIGETKTPCYLETQSFNNVCFYEKLGFEAKCKQAFENSDMLHYGMIYKL